MAICNDCKQEMREAKSCILPDVEIEGKWYKRNIQYHDINIKCHDCGIVNGNIHHFGCDMERCPVCKGQLISCGHHATAVGVNFEE
jgi:hypothetical protein